jgi:hypothetical protein
MTTGKLEVTIKINELPTDVQTNKDNWKIFQLDCDGRVVSVTVKPKIWKKLEDAAANYPSGWQLSVARWVNQPLTALCYQSQISKFLRENRRNPNLKQDSESSFKSRVRIWNYSDKVATVTRQGLGNAVPLIVAPLPVSFVYFAAINLRIN